MSRVYVVYSESIYDCCDNGHDTVTIHGVFSSSELAEKEIERLISVARKDEWNTVVDDDPDDIYIDDGLTETRFNYESYELDESLGE